MLQSLFTSFRHSSSVLVLLLQSACVAKRIMFNTERYVQNQSKTFARKIYVALMIA